MESGQLGRFNPEEKNGYRLSRKLIAHQRRSGRLGEEKLFCLCEVSNPGLSNP